MADDTSNFSGITVDSRARKYYEGWAYHSPLNGREWSKYWLVLRGNVLFICKNQRTADKRTHVGILQLSPDTEVKSVPYDKKKKHSFKFELFTSSHHQRKINIFKFEKENDRDVWKSYIMGIATGVVPRDVHLLPGQFKDVMESVGDFKNTPPPLPSGGTPRPRIPQNVGGLPRHDMYGDSGRSRGSDADSDGSGSFRSHLTTATRKNGAPNDKLQQLQSRQADLTMKTLQGDYGGDSDGFVKPQISNSEFSFGPTSSNARRDQIQRQEPQALNHGQHRDHDRSNYRDERSHKHERDQNDNFAMNYKDQHPDDLDIDDDFFNDGHQRFSSKQEENDSDDGTLGGEVKIRPKLPADWMMGGEGDVHPQTQTQRPVSGFPNPPPFSSLQRPTKADNNVQNKNNRNQQYNDNRQYGVDRQQSSNTQYDRRNSDHRQYGSEREDSQQHRGFTPAVYDVSPKRNEQYGGNQPNWSNTSSGTLRGNEAHRNDRSGSTSSTVRSEVVSLYGDLPTGRDPDDDDEPYAHQFYMNEDKNRYWPKWFFENLTREVAESVLTLGKRYGNVLMRESVTFRKTGSYVISMRREVSGGTQIHHYEITKSSRGGFKINVDNDHSTMRCLTDVMDFFVSSAGPTAKPMKNNDLASIGLSGFSKKKQTGHRGTRGYMDSDSGFDDLSTDDHHHQHSRSRGPSASSPPPAPPMAPPLASSSSQQSHFNTIPTPPPLQQAPFQHQTMPSSTNTQQNEPVTSLRDQLKLNRQISGGGLAIHGFVNSSIQEQAQQIAMEKQTLNTMRRDSLHSMPDDPPPSTPGSGSYEGNPFSQQPAHDPNQNLSFAAKAIGGIPSPPVFPHDFTQAVPSTYTPSETIRRSSSRSSEEAFNQQMAPLTNNMDELYLNQQYGSGTNSGMPPTPPPPPPPMNGNYPPPLPGGHPSLPATPVTPVPPPSFTPGPPSFAPGPPAPPGAPNFSYNTQPQQPHTPTSPGVGFNSSPQTAGFNTTPARQSGAGFGVPSFEDELKGRLQSQRDHIYATGATILKSNFN